MSIDQFIKKYWKQIQAWLAANSGGVVPQPSGGDVPFATDFLYNWNGGSCPLFLLSPRTTDTEFNTCIAWLKANGYTVVNPYMFNAGDGDGKHPVNCLTDYVEGRIKTLAENFAVVPFLWADDSAGITSRPASILIGDAKNALVRYGKYFSGIIPFLEPGDVKDVAKVKQVASAVIAATSLPVILHTNTVGTGPDFSKIDTFMVPGLNGIAYQTSNPSQPISPSQAQHVARAIKGRYPSMRVIAMEYAFSKPSIGDAVVATGVIDGIGNECSKAAIEKLPKWLKRV